MVTETFEQQQIRNAAEEEQRLKRRELINSGQMLGEIHTRPATTKRVFMGYDDGGQIVYDFVQVFE